MQPLETTGSELETMVDDSKVKFGRKGMSRERIVTIVVLGVAVIIFIVGIVLIAVAAAADKKDEESSSGTPVKPTSIPVSSKCSLSEEARRSGLPEFLSRVKATYYKLHPYDLDPDATTKRIKVEYVAYDPTPSVIKHRTDTALTLLKEINDKTINTDALKPRERKALAQVKHYLQHMFGQPYDVNYYAGDWMMGPNLFCWQPICSLGYGVSSGLGLNHKPYNASDVELIETKLKTHKAGILQYIENMKMGVRKGMVRSVEDCQAGTDALKESYKRISLYNETGKNRNDIFTFILYSILQLQLTYNAYNATLTIRADARNDRNNASARVCNQKSSADAPAQRWPQINCLRLYYSSTAPATQSRYASCVLFCVSSNCCIITDTIGPS